MRFIREMDDEWAGAALTDAINELREEPTPPSAKQVLDDVSLYLLSIGRYDIVYSVDSDERVVNVRDVHSSPNA